MQREAVLDGIGAGLEREPRAFEALGVGSHAPAHAVSLVDDGLHLLERQLRGLGILKDDRACSRRHELDEVGAAAELLADRLAHLPRPVRLAVHGPEDVAAR